MPYSQQIATTGGGVNDNYTYSLGNAQGAPPNNGLPPGMSLSATTGVLSGTPLAPGAYDFVVLVHDTTTGATGDEAFPLNISPLITLTPSLANATQGVPLSGQVITATGPAGESYTFSHTGNVPPGLTLATNGTLQGTPTQSGTFSFTAIATATDGSKDSGVQTYQMTVSPAVTFNPVPVATIETDGGGSTIAFPNLLPTVAVVGHSYSQTITASSVNGLASISFNTNNGGPLPTGLKIVTQSGTVTISGTATAPTQESSPVHINVTGKDNNGNTDTVIYELDVEANNASPFVAIQANQGGTLDDDLPAAVVGQAYPATTFTTSPGSGSYTFSLLSPTFSTTGDGALPPGMSFNAATATLSGTPAQAGLYSLIIQAASATNGITDSRVFHLTVGASTSGLQLGPATLPLASPDVPYRQQIAASGGNGATTLSYSFQNGTLSTLTGLGLSISQPQPNELVVSGTPIRTSTLPGASGPLTLSVTATDSLNHTTTVQYPIDIYYTPQQISEAYGLNMITLSGGVSGTGAGQTVAIVTTGDAPNLVSTNDPNFGNSDLHQFDVAFGLPDPPAFTKLNEYGGNDLPPTGSGSVHETTQDVEWVHALAPQAKIVLLESGVNIDLALETARRIPGVTVVSMSYSIFFDMDSQNSTNYVEPGIDSLFTSSAGHPMTFVISGGDANDGGLNHYPAISPNVVAVGYTSLTLNAQGGIAAQPAVAGADGGASTQELQPSDQSGVVSAVSTTMRTVPDVTFNGYGAGGSSVAVYDSAEQGDGVPWTYGDGTSISAPSWAALLSIIDQGEVLAGRSPLDGPTQTLPDLYALAGTSAFLPVTALTDGTVISPAFGTYNPYGGLGSPVANVLVADLVGTPTFTGLGAPTITFGTATTTLSGQIAAGTLIPSGSVAITLDGVTMNAPIDPMTGAFAADFPTSGLGVAGSPYTILYSYAANARFAAASSSTTLTVSPATPIIDWPPPSDIVYGTALDSTRLDSSASWTVDGQLVNVPGTFTYDPAPGAVLDAGDNQTVTVSFSPSDTADYTSANASATINVLPASPSLSGLSAPEITYGATTTTLSGGIAAGILIPSGDVAITLDGLTQDAPINSAGGFSADFATSAFGVANSPYTIAFSYAGDNDFAPVSSTTTLTVSPATPIIDWSQPDDIVYGTPLDSDQLDATASWMVGGQSGDVSGTFTYNPPAGTVLNAGDQQTLAVSFSPTDAADYTTASASITVNVAQHPTTTTVIASTPEGAPGQSITFTANVAGGLPSPYLTTGSVQFQINGADFGTPVPLASDDTATLTTTKPSSGSFSVTAMYLGDANFSSSRSTAVTETVLNPGVYAVGTTLYVVGASSNDSVLIGPAGGMLDGSTGLAVLATLNRVITVQTIGQPFTAIDIFGYGGNNTVVLSPTLMLPTTVVAGDGNNVVQLGGGNDVITLGDGNDVVSAGNGDDDVTVGDGNNVLDLGDGSDVIVEGNGNDVVSAGNGSDLVVAGLGRHTIQLGNGNDILIDGAASVAGAGDSFRQILSDWNTSASASVDTRLNVVYNVVHPNVLHAGTGRNWFFFTLSKDVTSKKAGDRLN